MLSTRLNHLATFVALSLAPAASGATTITVWHDMEKASANFLQALADEFSAASGAHVELQGIGDVQLKSSLVKMAANRQLPDIVLCPADYVGLADVLRLSKIPLALQTHAIAREHWQTARVNGRVYGVPVMAGNHLMMFYNRRLVSSPALTWDELELEQKRRKASHPYVIGWYVNNAYWFAPFLQYFGGPVLSGRMVGVDAKPLRQAFEFYKGLTDRGLVDRHCDSTCSHEQFFSARLPYIIEGDWFVATARNKLGEQLGLAKLPKIGGRAMPAMTSTHVLLFPEYSLTGPKGAILTAFARFFLSAKMQQRAWSDAERIPVDRSVLRAFYLRADPLHKAMLDALEGALPMPSEPVMAFVWEGLRRSITGYLSGNLNIDEALVITKKTIDDEMQKSQQTHSSPSGGR